jgi:hypothetical protein
VIDLTTGDRSFLQAIHVAAFAPETPEEIAAMKMIRRHGQLMDKITELEAANLELREDRHYWYRCCRAAIVFAVVLAACWGIREVLF